MCLHTSMATPEKKKPTVFLFFFCIFDSAVMTGPDWHCVMCAGEQARARRQQPANKLRPSNIQTPSFFFVCVYVCGGVRRDYDIFSPNKGEILSSYSTRSGYFFYLFLFLFNSLQLFHFPPLFTLWYLSPPQKSSSFNSPNTSSWALFYFSSPVAFRFFLFTGAMLTCCKSSGDDLFPTLQPSPGLKLK
jgi:hypothetical protein